jgi:hypothetical protein
VSVFANSQKEFEAMFKPGDKLIVSVIENGDGATDYHNMTVLEYDDGLLKLEQSGKIYVFNTHSRNFVKATVQN